MKKVNKISLKMIYNNNYKMKMIIEYKNSLNIMNYKMKNENKYRFKIMNNNNYYKMNKIKIKIVNKISLKMNNNNYYKMKMIIENKNSLNIMNYIMKNENK